MSRVSVTSFCKCVCAQPCFPPLQAANRTRQPTMYMQSYDEGKSSLSTLLLWGKVKGTLSGKYNAVILNHPPLTISSQNEIFFHPLGLGARWCGNLYATRSCFLPTPLTQVQHPPLVLAKPESLLPPTLLNHGNAPPHKPLTAMRPQKSIALRHAQVSDPPMASRTRRQSG